METKEILKKLRKSQDLTMQEFCAKSGISINTYQNYETGKRIPTADILIKLADFYGVTTDYLLGREPPPNPFADLDLPPESEKEVLDKYMSFPPEIRACLLDALRKLGAAADGNTAKPEPKQPEEPAPKSIADDMMDTVRKGEQMFSKEHTNKK